MSHHPSSPSPPSCYPRTMASTCMLMLRMKEHPASCSREWQYRTWPAPMARHLPRRASRATHTCVRASKANENYRAHVNPNVIFFVENHGTFRKLPCVAPYIQNGQSRMLQYGNYAPNTHSLKATIVLTNCTSWRPRSRPMRLTKSVVH
jgi:hypothetical protein